MDAQEAWRTLIESDERKGLVASGRGLLENVASPGGGTLGEQVKTFAGGDGKIPRGAA